MTEVTNWQPTAACEEITFSIADCARRVSVAPMMDCTDRHDRYLLRLISKRVLLYTEMLTTGAVLFGKRDRMLRFDPAEHPVALQLGGSDPQAMARCAEIGAELGYDEVNVNCGCPSDRVQSGRFGACLMAEPQLVAECVAAMRARIDVPVTVKTRIGIDDRDSFGELCDFVETVSYAGCGTFIVHARKAWLAGLSPKENRTVPPLRYDWVYRLKETFPQLRIIINGGVKTLDHIHAHLAKVDGVMVGREAYANPFLFANVDQRVYGEAVTPPTRDAVLSAYIEYCETQLAQGCRLSHLSRHVVGLFQGQPNARAWRRYLSEHAHKPGAGIDVIRDAAGLVLE